MIGAINCEVSEQVGIDFMRRMRPAGFRFRINRLQAHQPHQSLNPFAVDLIAQSPKVVSHRTAAPAGAFQILLIDQAHQLQILGLNRFLFVVECGAIQIQYSALLGHAQLPIIGIDHFTPLFGA